MADTPKPATLIAQAMGAIEPGTRGVVPPVYPATTFERAPDGGLPGGHSYGRDECPGYEAPEALLMHLEQAADGNLFASGMAAAVALFLALPSGSHVVAPARMYWGLRGWLRNEAPDYGLRVDFFEVSPDPKATEAAIAAALRPGETALLWIETPANPTWEVTDIAAAATLAHAAGALLAVDSTVPTPILTRPLALGADYVMHSATKALNGHSDVIAGALLTAQRDALWSRVKLNRAHLGAVLGAFEAWLLLRGLRTLHLRVERASANALAIAERFGDDARLEAVLYPGLAEDPGHAVAAKQMTGGFGSMLSIRVTGGYAGAAGVLSRLRLWKRATSLGGVESLVEHRAAIEGPDSPCPPDLLRLSTGIEAAEDLIADLEQALG